MIYYNQQNQPEENKADQFFEFYLFVNPLGKNCYETEKEVKEALEQLKCKHEFHVVCYLTPDTISNFLLLNGFDPADLNSRNIVYQTLYRASIAYKAASMQGRKIGRKFLNLLQKEIKGDILVYSLDLAKEIADYIGLDLDWFSEDLVADRTKQAFFTDQKIAHDMGIIKTPSLVIFEHYHNEHGYKMQDFITKDDILEQVKIMSETNSDDKLTNGDDPCIKLISHLKK